MKTETSFYVTNFLQKPVLIIHKPHNRTVVKQVYRSDLRNHRFAVIDNTQISNPVNWDESWFTNYE